MQKNTQLNDFEVDCVSNTNLSQMLPLVIDPFWFLREFPKGP